MCKSLATLALFAAFITPVAVHAQADARAAVQTMIAREEEASHHKPPYIFQSTERSDRTGGHLWTERVVETPIGRVRFLLAEDGQPLTPDRMAQERGRLANDIANPQAFADRESAQKDEEAHARQLLQLLGKGFLLEGAPGADHNWRINFQPDPNYSPSGMEERVIHGMSGYLIIDGKSMRMRHIEGSLPKDLSIGFGLLATVRAGSHFESTKGPVEGGTWRTLAVINDIHGKAALFKTIAKNQTVTRSDFRRAPESLTLAQAVALVEQP